MNFVLIGAAGYIAPRHMKAIKETGNSLVAALDKNDSVGILDSYFPESAFFTEFERFDRHIEKLKRSGISIDYVSICSPNYLHDAHIRFALRHGANAICEKPLALNPWNLSALRQTENETGKKVYTILQLRHHPTIIALKKKIDSESSPNKYEVALTYITSRGKWYYASWKGDQSKSGGISTNIGIHFFDMLSWLFGNVIDSKVHIHTHDRAAGYIELDKAKVKWFLSINQDTIPESIRITDVRTHRSIIVDGEEIEFSDGFSNLHTLSYKAIINGDGFGIAEAKPAIDIVHNIREQLPTGIHENFHPLAKLPLVQHPFKNINQNSN